jgi:hypothetical protein
MPPVPAPEPYLFGFDIRFSRSLKTGTANVNPLSWQLSDFGGVWFRSSLDGILGENEANF